MFDFTRRKINECKAAVKDRIDRGGDPYAKDVKSIEDFITHTSTELDDAEDKLDAAKAFRGVVEHFCTANGMSKGGQPVLFLHQIFTDAPKDHRKITELAKVFADAGLDPDSGETPAQFITSKCKDVERLTEQLAETQHQLAELTTDKEMSQHLANNLRIPLVEKFEGCWQAEQAKLSANESNNAAVNAVGVAVGNVFQKLRAVQESEFDHYSWLSLEIGNSRTTGAKIFFNSLVASAIATASIFGVAHFLIGQ